MTYYVEIITILCYIFNTFSFKYTFYKIILAIIFISISEPIISNNITMQVIKYNFIIFVVSL